MINKKIRYETTTESPELFKELSSEKGISRIKRRSELIKLGSTHISYWSSACVTCTEQICRFTVMTQQYVGHMTEERYGCIVQLVDHSAGTRRFDSSFVLLSYYLAGQMSGVRPIHPSHLFF